MQFKVGSAIPEGTNALKLKLIVSYVDANGDTHNGKDTPQEINILNVTKQTEEQTKDNIEITNISQSPASPVDGGILVLHI